MTLDGGGVSATTSQGLVVGPGAGPIRVQASTIRGTAVERVLIDGGLGVELLEVTIQGGLAGPGLRVQGATHGFLLQLSRVEGSPAEGLVLAGSDHTQARVTQTLFTDNAGTALALDATGVLVDNNLLVGNGAGIWVQDAASSNRFVNNTVADNGGVGVQIDELAAGTSLVNTLLWGNTSALVNLGTETVSQSTLTANPGFGGGGDYHLALGTSPAADTGTPLPEGPFLALDGVLRPQGGGWDIGAYERAGSAVCCTCTSVPATLPPFDYFAIQDQTGVVWYWWVDGGGNLEWALAPPASATRTAQELVLSPIPSWLQSSAPLRYVFPLPLTGAPELSDVAPAVGTGYAGSPTVRGHGSGLWQIPVTATEAIDIVPLF